MPATDVPGILALGVPVLCMDTCSILDLIRDPQRKSIKPGERSAALDLLHAAAAGPRLVILHAQQVTAEVAENETDVCDETTRAIAQLKDTVARVDAIDGIYGGGGTAILTHLDDHVARAKRYMDRWVAASRPAAQATDVAQRAWARVQANVAPSRKGKDSMKDCVVIETYLDAVSELRAAGHTAPIVFCSSNVNDYAEANSITLKADLLPSFGAINLQYAPNLGLAKRLLGL